MLEVFHLDILVSLVTLTVLEVVLGIDNIVVLTLVLDRLPPEQRPQARKVGLIFALVARLGLLSTLSAVMRLTRPFTTVLGHPLSGRDIILLLGGLFLIWKSSQEIYERVDASDDENPQASWKGHSFAVVILQIVLLDIVFSLDSVITAVGMAQRLGVMATAVILGAVIMMVFAKLIGDLLTRHPSLKILALSFLLMVGVLLVAEGTGQHVNKGYIYFAMAFAFGVEVINMVLRRRSIHAQLKSAPGSELVDDNVAKPPQDEPKDPR